LGTPQGTGGNRQFAGHAVGLDTRGQGCHGRLNRRIQFLGVGRRRHDEVMESFEYYVWWLSESVLGNLSSNDK